MNIPAEYATYSDIEIARLCGVTRQAVFHARRRAAGLCERCGEPVETQGDQYCAAHRRFKAWQPGGRGRPPAKGVATP